MGKKKCGRPLTAKHKKRQHDRVDIEDGEVHYCNPRDVEFKELREFS